MIYGFLTAAEPAPDAIARALAEAFHVPARAVDVSPADEFEHRNREATVTCDYESLPGSDLAGRLSVYGADEVTGQAPEDGLAAALANAVTPGGPVTFARVEPSDAAACTVSATQTALPELPEEPAAQQVGAWVELAGLCRTSEFRAAIRRTEEQVAEPSRTDVPALHEALDRAIRARLWPSADPLVDRYWTLLATVNGWPPSATFAPVPSWFTGAAA
ncbi:hypothetical protein [Streptomyces sp. NPDC029003]|uniref:hypothetical protein n=1 Tax=Streptomyces sp. NPDC029003 TaxID=3155125 RepID=UPI0033D7D48B